MDVYLRWDAWTTAAVGPFCVSSVQSALGRSAMRPRQSLQRHVSSLCARSVPSMLHYSIRSAKTGPYTPRWAYWQSGVILRTVHAMRQLLCFPYSSIPHTTNHLQYIHSSMLVHIPLFHIQRIIYDTYIPSCFSTFLYPVYNQTFTIHTFNSRTPDHV